MIVPFNVKCLKGASYDVIIEGEVVYWDEDGHKHKVDLKKNGDYFDLRPNSIAFVTLQPYFQLPYYIALRFNLKITHIYKGLLLGTGPLVDPGFCGKLSIPLHNLTSNTYRFFKGEELITMEFTKMSRNILWQKMSSDIGHGEKYIINAIKSDRTVDEYIFKALEADRLGQVISSIPTAMQKSKSDIEKLKKKTEIELEKNRKEVNKNKVWGYVVNIAGFISIATIIFSALSFAMDIRNSANERYNELQNKYEVMQKQYGDKIDSLENEILELRTRLNLYNINRDDF